MRTTVRKVLGDKVADRCSDVWDLDEEGELRAVRYSSSKRCLYDKMLISFRCGDQAAIQASGTLVGILHFVGYIRNF